jgi:hypothetical protein
LTTAPSTLDYINLGLAMAACCWRLSIVWQAASWRLWGPRVTASGRPGLLGHGGVVTFESGYDKSVPRQLIGQGFTAPVVAANVRTWRSTMIRHVSSEDRLDPDYASRDVFSFHRPETMAGWLDELRRHPPAPTLRHRLRALPQLEMTGLRPAQFVAIQNLERSLAANRPKAPIQMATGAGKTMTAASVAYRIVKHADARRVLFLVDRATLGRQTLKEFQGFSTPDDGRKLTELYNVQHLRSQRVDPVSRVTISTIQRIYSILRGDPELDVEADEVSLDEHATEPLPVEYSAALPAYVRRRDRGRRGRDGSAQAPRRVRRPHAAATPDRRLLRARCQGECPLLRPQTRLRDAVDA